jgi:hypothetical protein
MDEVQASARPRSEPVPLLHPWEGSGAAGAIEFHANRHRAFCRADQGDLQVGRRRTRSSEAHCGTLFARGLKGVCECAGGIRHCCIASDDLGQAGAGAGIV